MQGNTVSVERVIKAPAREIFALSPTRDSTPSFDGSGTVRPFGRPSSSPLELGTTFSMRMRGRPETLFLPYTTNNKVIEFEPDRRIAWQTHHLGGLVGGRIWRYELTPDRGRHAGPRDVGRLADRQRPMLKMGSMPRQAEDGMRATLARIAALVET